MTEPRAVNKPSRWQPKSLRDLLSKVVADSFAKQGFASAELVTRWKDIVGAEIAAHSEPMKINWPRPAVGEPRGNRPRWCCGSRARRRSKSSTSRT